MTDPQRLCLLLAPCFYSNFVWLKKRWTKPLFSMPFFSRILEIHYFKIKFTFSVAKKSLPSTRLQRFSPIFLEKFYCFRLYIKIYNPSWIIFLYMDQSSLFLHIQINCSSTNCWKGSLFSTELILHFCKTVTPYMCQSIPGL